MSSWQEASEPHVLSYWRIPWAARWRLRKGSIAQYPDLLGRHWPQDGQTAECGYSGPNYSCVVCMGGLPRRTWGERTETLGRTQAGLPVQASAASAGLQPEPDGLAAWAGAELHCDRIRAENPDDLRAPPVDAPPSSSFFSSFSFLSFLVKSQPPPSTACFCPLEVALHKEITGIESNLKVGSEDR